MVSTVIWICPPFLATFLVQMLPPVLWRVAALWRVGLRLAGLLLPPALALVGLFRGWKKGSLGDWKKISPVILGVVALINWVVLVCFIANEKLGVGLDYRLSRWTPALLKLSLVSVVVSIGAYAFRRSFLIANSLLLFMWFDIGYAPSHLLETRRFRQRKRKRPACVRCCVYWKPDIQRS
jgi:hypothetical protein